MREDVEHLRAWVKSGCSDGTPPKDAIADAVRSFWHRQEFASFSAARYTCFGCADPIGRDGYRLIEDEARFPKLLNCVDQYQPEPRRLRRCYRGLLHGYISYDPKRDEAKPAGRKNWTRLQAYLAQRVGQICIPTSMEPDWVAAITRNQDLLTERACGEMGRQALEGTSDRFDQMCRELEIADQSWVVRNFILAQLDAATAKSDHLYRQLLPRLEQLLKQHPLCLDEGLAKLLERYRACSPPELHTHLRDFAVGQWGNPWLKLNDKRWGRVSPGAREMVTGWLKLKLMRDFFSLLTEERTNDRRRLEFWLRYIDQISDMHFALGPDALYNTDPDFEQLRKEMTGRLLYLSNGGSPSNNAFLMSIGDHLIVEFGEKGNACFAFDTREDLPFQLEGYVAGNSSALKHCSYKLRLLHINRNDATWEEQFQHQLQHRLGISAGGTLPRPNPARPTLPARHQPASTGPVFSDGVFQQWALENRVKVSDKRRIGGALWVHVGKSETSVTAQLRRWSFKYNEHKTAWWRG